MSTKRRKLKEAAFIQQNQESNPLWFRGVFAKHTIQSRIVKFSYNILANQFTNLNFSHCVTSHPVPLVEIMQSAVRACSITTTCTCGMPFRFGKSAAFRVVIRTRTCRFSVLYMTPSKATFSMPKRWSKVIIFIFFALFNL